MDEVQENYKDVSISTTNTFLCPKRGYMDVKDQQMKPGDADYSHFEEMFLEDRILRILTCNSFPREISFLYQNENFLYDPSAVSYFEEELEMANSTYIVAPRRNTGEDTVAVLYFPRQREAETVTLKEATSNIFQRLWSRIKRAVLCVQVDED